VRGSWFSVNCPEHFVCVCVVVVGLDAMCSRQGSFVTQLTRKHHDLPINTFWDPIVNDIMSVS
jgi:hypothetical protein